MSFRTRSMTWDAEEHGHLIRKSSNLVQQRTRKHRPSIKLRRMGSSETIPEGKASYVNASEIKSYQMRTNLTERVVRQSLFSFNEFDTNGNGEIDENEFADAICAMGISATKDQISSVMKLMNKQNNTKKCTIDKDMFLKMVKQIHEHEEVDDEESGNILTAFAALGGNRNKTGSISAKKLQSMIDMFGLNIDTEKLMKYLDSDHNGLVNFEEFKQLFASQDTSEKIGRTVENMVNDI